MPFKRELSLSADDFDPYFSPSPKKAKVKSTPTKTSPKSSPVKNRTWSDDDLRLVVALRDEGVSFEYVSGFYRRASSRDIATHFPGRTASAIQTVYVRHRKEMKEVFTPEKVV
jgi:hypothetical protein